MAIQLICKSEECTGCGMCEQICSHKAIIMQPDQEGFLHPHINDSCVECGLCQLKCPVNALVARFNPPIKIFSGWSNNEATRIKSSSGGAFTEIAKLVFDKGGVVFGASMNRDLKVEHIFIEKETELFRLRGSKYVQSIIGETYKQAQSFLRQGRMVLFSGTPCQIAGLRNFLHKDYENLCTVDLICHGVPSPRVFEDYKRYIENIIKETITCIEFRCKKASWIFFNIGINPDIEKNGYTNYSYIGNYYSDPYIRAFLRDNILRSNCYKCQYTSLNRVSDFTIADWWGYKATSNKDKHFDKKGVSLIMCNTLKAVNMANHLDMYLKERTKEEALHTNLSLQKPFPRPSTRDDFWKDYERKPFDEMVQKWMRPEKIPLSTYVKIYHREYKTLYRLIHLYECIVRKAHLSKLLIKLQAK